METVQGFAAAEQEKEEGKEKVEGEENARRMKKNKEKARKTCRKGKR